MRTNSRITLALTACGLLVALAWFRPWVNHEPPPQSGALSDKPAETSTAKPAVRLPVSNRPLSTAKEPQATAVNTPVVAVNPHLRDYEASDNLAQLVASLEDDVRAGDTRAAWVVVNALQECDQRNLIPSLKWPPAERARKAGNIPEEKRESTLRHLARLEQRCSQFALEGKALADRVLEAHATAVSGNDAISEVTQFADSLGSKTPQEANDLLRRIVQSHDPWAIWSMADVTGAEAKEHGYEGPYVGSLLHARAWKLVACKLGYPCGPDSVEVRRLCAVYSQCVNDGYEAVVRQYYVSPAEFNAVAAMRDEILRLIAAGDYYAIFP